MNQTNTTKSSNTGLSGMDIASIALQLYGSYEMDKAAEEERKRQEERDNMARVMEGRQMRMAEKQNFESNLQNRRSQNMSAANMLYQMRNDAMNNRNMYGSRRAVLNAL